MLALTKAMVISYFALLIFASCTERIRGSIWGRYFNDKAGNKHLPPMFINGLRIGACGLVALAISQFSRIYGVSIGITNWFCLAAILGCFVVATLSYAKTSLIKQICVFGVFSVASFIL
ncbi:DUF3325 family protein [Vibrio mimicus]|uniref:DUF3325 family protein n=1 Tax=Vibrio mimicus TaxID=674 RepID=UPI00076B6CEB|nr:DUF3325 family protein [Vibrio mimicus]AMG03804.1 DUF3325 domain-containing protein [Vibrio mimicus]KAA3491292.1 DUF3325 family protein [Vibrio mimicus]